MSAEGGKKLQKRWIPLESNPEIINSYLEKLGFPTEEYCFYDVFSTEEWALAMVPRPVIGVMMLFPIKDGSEKHMKDEQERLERHGQLVSDKLYFVSQTVENACGTIGILHCIGNALDMVTLEKDSWADRFITSTTGKDPDEIANILEEDDEVGILLWHL